MAARRAKPSDPARVHAAFMAAFSGAVRNARIIRGHTQAALAARVGIATNTIARIERGELCPSVFIAQRLADALDVGVETLTRPVREAPPLVGRRR